MLGLDLIQDLLACSRCCVGLGEVVAVVCEVFLDFRAHPVAYVVFQIGDILLAQLFECGSDGSVDRAAFFGDGFDNGIQIVQSRCRGVIVAQCLFQRIGRSGFADLGCNILFERAFQPVEFFQLTFEIAYAVEFSRKFVHLASEAGDIGNCLFDGFKLLGKTGYGYVHTIEALVDGVDVVVVVFTADTGQHGSGQEQCQKFFEQVVFHSKK